MGGYMRDESNRLSNVNIVFESFMRGVNGCVCLLHDWFSKAYGKLRRMRRARAEK